LGRLFESDRYYTHEVLQRLVPHKGRLWDRVNPTGFGLATGYVVLVVAVFALTAATTSPSNVGLDWIPFYLLTMPWSGWIHFDPDAPWYRIVTLIAFLAGIVVNTAAIYIIGSLMQPMWVQFMNWHKNRDH
jgi:hypothetical protein